MVESLKAEHSRPLSTEQASPAGSGPGNADEGMPPIPSGCAAGGVGTTGEALATRKVDACPERVGRMLG